MENPCVKCSEWELLEHPLLVKSFEEKVKFHKARGKKVLVDMMIADVPHINSMICKTLATYGVDGVTVLEEVGDLDKIDSHGLELFIVSVEELNIILESD